MKQCNPCFFFCCPAVICWSFLGRPQKQSMFNGWFHLLNGSDQRWNGPFLSYALRGIPGKMRTTLLSTWKRTVFLFITQHERVDIIKKILSYNLPGIWYVNEAESGPAFLHSSRIGWIAEDVKGEEKPGRHVQLFSCCCALSLLLFYYNDRPTNIDPMLG